MQRDMSCDLDDEFSTRNVGEVQTLATPKTRVMRTPGLVAIRDGNGYTAETVQTPRNLTDVADGSGFGPLPGLADLNLPVVGKLDAKSLAIGAVIAAAVVWFIKRK